MKDQIYKLLDPTRPYWHLVNYPKEEINMLPEKWVYNVKTDENNMIL